MRSRVTRLAASFVSGTVLSSSGALSQTVSQSPTPIPFVLAEDAGIRPLIHITVNGLSLRAVVHANASSFLQLNHEQASAAKITNLKHVGDYGISKPGSLSSKGRELGTATTLSVGSTTDSAVAVDVFEKYSPDGQDIPMVGLKWIRAHQLIMDFAKKQIFMDPSPSIVEEENRALLSAGYSRHKMYLDPKDNRYLVQVRIKEKVSAVVVGTVAGSTLDTAFAASSSVESGSAKGTFGGPGGATGETAESAQPVRLIFDEFVAAPQRFSIEDTYTYIGAKRPTESSFARGGQLGSDFMTANQAVVDFGSGVLYLK